MIYGFDHIALSTQDIDKEIKKFESLGYEIVFSEPDLMNHNSKSRFLDHYFERHSITLMKSKYKGFNIELIDHGNLNKDRIGPYNIFKLNEIILKTSKLKEDKSFLQNCFNLKLFDNNILFLKRAVLSWSIKIKLIKTVEYDSIKLDDSGFVCLTFFCSDLNSELKEVDNFGGFDILSPFKLSVNGKMFLFSIFRLPGGSICELIQKI